MERGTGATLLMTSISFGMFTAAWPYVANECRVATRQEEGVKREREIQKVGVREEGSGPCRWYKTDYTALPGRGPSACYIREIFGERVGRTEGAEQQVRTEEWKRSLALGAVLALVGCRASAKQKTWLHSHPDRFREPECVCLERPRQGWNEAQTTKRWSA